MFQNLSAGHLRHFSRHRGTLKKVALVAVWCKGEKMAPWQIKEQSGEINLSGVFTYPIAIILTLENGALYLRLKCGTANFKLCSAIEYLRKKKT